MSEKNVNRMKQFLDMKNQQKETQHLEKPSRKMGKTHKAYSSQKHGGPMSKI